VKASQEHIPDFSLIPYHEDKGPQINATEQIPDDDPAFYRKYYHNHRVLQHGNLTGMIQFHCSVSWSKLKNMKGDYFHWLHWNKVFINQTKFKTDTLVACGFLVCAHPGHMRRDEAEQEMWSSLNLGDEVQFQLSSRTVTVPMGSNTKERYSFQVVIIETAANQARKMRESCFALPKPSVSREYYPYTGPYQFVPLIESKEWPAVKFFQLAKVHVKICQNLRPIYLENIQDIRNQITDGGHMLLRGFLSMTHNIHGAAAVPLIHSVHNTAREHTKVV
jgi:hypothetical protein